jgi:hypothetical protein
MPIHTDSLLTADTVALECLIRQLVEKHLASPLSQEYLSQYSESFLSKNHPEWATALSGMQQSEAIALLATAARTLQLKMEVQDF